MDKAVFEALWNVYESRPKRTCEEYRDIIASVPELAPVASEALHAREDCTLDDRLYIIEKRGDLPVSVKIANYLRAINILNEHNLVLMLRCIEDPDTRTGLARELLADLSVSADSLNQILEALPEEEALLHKKAATRLAEHDGATDDHLYGLACRYSDSGHADLQLKVLAHPNVNSNTLVRVIQGATGRVQDRALGAYLARKDFRPSFEQFTRVLDSLQLAKQFEKVVRRVMAVDHRPEVLGQLAMKLDCRADKAHLESFWFSLSKAKTRTLADLYFIVSQLKDGVKQTRVHHMILEHSGVSSKDFERLDSLYRNSSQGFWCPYLSASHPSSELLRYLSTHASDTGVREMAARIVFESGETDFWRLVSIYETNRGLRELVRPQIETMIPALAEKDLVPLFCRMEGEYSSWAWDVLKRNDLSETVLRDLVVNQPRYRSEAWFLLKNHPRLDRYDLQEVAEHVSELADEANELLTTIDNSELIDDMKKLSRQYR